MVDYWEHMFATVPEIPAKGLVEAVSKSDPARDGVFQRIKAPTLLMTADRGQAQSVEKARQYQTFILKFSAGSSAERRLSHRCLKCRRVHYQRPRLHQGSKTPALAACGLSLARASSTKSLPNGQQERGAGFLIRPATLSMSWNANSLVSAERQPRTDVSNCSNIPQRVCQHVDSRQCVFPST
jgi:hypothetical protein